MNKNWRGQQKQRRNKILRALPVTVTTTNVCTMKGCAAVYVGPAVCGT